MVERRIRYVLSVEETEEAAANVAGVAGEFGNLAEQAESATRAQGQFTERARESTQQSIAFTQKVSAAANAVQSLVGQLGGGSRTAGLVGALTASIAAGAQLGSVFGPTGTLIGAVTSALPVVAQLTGLIEDQASAHDRARRAADQQTEALDRLAERQRVIASIGRDDASDEDVARGAYAIQGELATARGELRRARGRGADDRQLAARVRELERDLRVAASQLQRRQERAAGAEGEELLEQMVALARDPNRRRGGGGGQSEEEALEEQFQAMLARRREYEDQVDALKAETDRRELEREEETRELDRRALETSLDAQEEASRRRIEMIEREAERTRELIEAETEQRGEALQRQKRAEEEAFDKRREQQEVFVDLATNSSRSLVKAFSAIASGSQDAGSAFKGLLADFLVFIAEKALLQAATEYAEAAGAFARYDYGGGAAHIAAGVAFTGVAIAAGVGAGALQAPSAPASQPSSARPRAEQSQGGAGGNVTYVYQLNGPTLTAQGDALLGRRLNAIGTRGVRRFGVAA